MKINRCNENQKGNSNSCERKKEKEKKVKQDEMGEICMRRNTEKFVEGKSHLK